MSTQQLAFFVNKTFIIKIIQGNDFMKVIYYPIKIINISR